MKKIILIMAIFSLNACSTVKLGGPFIALQPENNLNASLYIYRPKEASLRDAKILINSEFTTEIASESFFQTYLTPGIHDIKIKWGAMNDIPEVEKHIKVENNNTYFLKLSTGYNNEGILFLNGMTTAIPAGTFWSNLELVGKKRAIAELKNNIRVIHQKKP